MSRRDWFVDERGAANLSPPARRAVTPTISVTRRSGSVLVKSCEGVERHSESTAFSDCGVILRRYRTGLITREPTASSAGRKAANIASFSYVPTIAPPDPAKFALAPHARAASTI